MNNLNIIQQDKNTCWYSKGLAHSMSIMHAKWKKVDEVENWIVLLKYLQYCKNNNAKTILDLGCGAGHHQKTEFIRNNLDYTGADLPNVIDTSSVKIYPEGKYISLDIYSDKIEFIKNFDIVLMNAFIDVIEFPLDILNKVLTYINKFVILHRQRLSDKKTYIEKHQSYNGFTYISIINNNDFLQILEKNNIEILEKNQIGTDYYSFLMEKK
jgi:putative methyltransferase (TIGR04325 family)